MHTYTTIQLFINKYIRLHNTNKPKTHGLYEKLYITNTQTCCISNNDEYDKKQVLFDH